MFDSLLSDEFDQIMPLGRKLPPPGVHMFYIIISLKHKKKTCLKSLGLEP